VLAHFDLVRRGIKDVRGAVEKLKGFRAWSELQAALLGSLTIDVREVCACLHVCVCVCVCMCVCVHARVGMGGQVG
jgi:hypothetical protein